MPRLLDKPLLEELHQLWHQQGAEVAGALAPGMADEDMDALTEPLCFRLQGEPRTWWGWHNGVLVSTPRGWDVGPDFGIYSLPQAIDEFLAQPLGGGGKSAPDTWFPFGMAPGGWIVLDRAH